MKNVIPDKLQLYYLFRDRMQTGDLVEIRTHSITGCGIRRVTKKSVNHTALVLKFYQYDQERVFILEALEHGIVLNLLSRRLLDLDGRAVWLGLTDSWDGFRPAIGREALKYVGVAYDFGSVIKSALSRVSADARRLFCSEFAYLALLDGGLPVHRDTVPWPGEMFDLGVFHRPRLILS